jgi:hypothetical protein
MLITPPPLKYLVPFYVHAVPACAAAGRHALSEGILKGSSFT